MQSESCFHSLSCHFSGSGSSFWAWFTSWCWVGSLISSSVSSVSGKPFVPGILCGLSVPLASPGSPSGSCPGLIRTASGPAIYLGLWLAPFRSVSLGSSPAAAQAQLGFSPASGLPPLSRLRVWVRPERGSPPAPRSGPRPLAAPAAGQAFHPDAPGASHPAGLRRNAPAEAGLPAPNLGPLPCPAARRSIALGVCVVAEGGTWGGRPGAEDAPGRGGGGKRGGERAGPGAPDGRSRCRRRGRGGLREERSRGVGRWKRQRDRRRSASGLSIGERAAGRQGRRGAESREPGRRRRRPGPHKGPRLGP